MPDYYQDSESEKLFQQTSKFPKTQPNPHIRGNQETQTIMLMVILALLPAILFSGYLFGWTVYFNYLLAMVTGICVEFLWFKWIKRRYQWDYSAVLTALLLGMNLPPSAPWYFPIIGTTFAIIVIKEFFGGLGYNFINPALGGRAFLVALFYQQMFTISWPDPPFNKLSPQPFDSTIDTLSGATPLAIMRAGETLSLDELNAAFFGFIGGRAGETSAFLLLLGGIFLIYKKIIGFHIPLIVLGTIGLGAFILGPTGLFTGSWQNIIGHIISGGAILGAFFMATDYASTPSTKMGEIIFAFGVGLLVVVFRFFGLTNEGVSYGILIMNCFTPAIDRLLRLRVLGEGKQSPFNLKINA